MLWAAGWDRKRGLTPPKSPPFPHRWSPNICTIELPVAAQETPISAPLEPYFCTISPPISAPFDHQFLHQKAPSFCTVGTLLTHHLITSFCTKRPSTSAPFDHQFLHHWNPIAVPGKPQFLHHGNPQLYTKPVIQTAAPSHPSEHHLQPQVLRGTLGWKPGCRAQEHSSSAEVHVCCKHFFLPHLSSHTETHYRVG